MDSTVSQDPEAKLQITGIQSVQVEAKKRTVKALQTAGGHELSTVLQEVGALRGLGRSDVSCSVVGAVGLSVRASFS